MLYKGVPATCVCRVIGFCQSEWPTALAAPALTTSLLASGVDWADCKKFLAIFSVATPVCAALAGPLLWFFQCAGGGNNDWSVIAMLVSVRCLAKATRALTELPLS